MLAEATTSNEETEAAKKARLQRIKRNTKRTLLLCFILFTAIHISMIVVASLYLQNCPVQPNIPPFLFTMGILGILSNLVTLFKHFINRHEEISLISILIGMIKLGVLMGGTYYVCAVYEPNYDPDSGNCYCNETVYRFLFIYITITYVTMLLVVMGVCCTCVVFACARRSQGS